MPGSFADEICAEIVRDLFNIRIMANINRSQYMERVVHRGLGAGFNLVSGWRSWDIEQPQGLRIEVKQSAARQSWMGLKSDRARPTAGSYDIAPRTGHWEQGGSRWIKSGGRHAHIYVFAWHPIFDPAKVDQRDPSQWRFFVVPTERLPPNQKSIARRVVETRWGAVGFEGLREAVLDHSGLGASSHDSVPSVAVER